ncbi:hypothetical protein DE146DRAFT_767563 [Phaeosphaeria sp. MPI-PUGE-AT-0046c]|nr:hypothetical protein DE146DRAFT_767563 [Phaeosphaeria sp. MPI-PUGE-AT-0046c]
MHISNFLAGATQDHYAVLGLDMTASMVDVKRAYHRSVRKCHPDRLAHASTEDRADAEDRTKRLNNANEILSDPVSRAAYDQVHLKSQVVQPTDASVPRHSYHQQPRRSTVPRTTSFQYQRQEEPLPANTPQSSGSKWRTSAFPSHGKGNSFYSHAWHDFMMRGDQYAPSVEEAAHTSSAGPEAFPRAGSSQYVGPGSQPYDPQPTQEVPLEAEPGVPTEKTRSTSGPEMGTFARKSTPISETYATPQQRTRSRTRAGKPFFPEVVHRTSGLDFMAEDFLNNPPWAHKPQNSSQRVHEEHDPKDSVLARAYSMLSRPFWTKQASNSAEAPDLHHSPQALHFAPVARPRKSRFVPQKQAQNAAPGSTERDPSSAIADEDAENDDDASDVSEDWSLPDSFSYSFWNLPSTRATDHNRPAYKLKGRSLYRRGGLTHEDSLSRKK